eukprot:gene17593-19346_t
MNIDKRFASIGKDARFKKIPKKERKVKIDSRFKSMFTDQKFKAKYSVDKRGRPLLTKSKENLEKFYQLEDEPETSKYDKQPVSEILLLAVEADSSDDNEDEIDFSNIRGGDGSSSSSDEEEVAEDEDTQIVEHEWGELDKEAPRKDDAVTSRLAACNLDWDRVTADDLFILFSSLGGAIKSVRVFLSEFGKQRLAEEELSGPTELANIKGSRFQLEKLREYQLKRLKYYYAIVDCDSKETANKIYDEYDGLEYELSATRLDLRFVPEDMDFEDEPTSITTQAPLLHNYRPTAFINTALQQTTVRSTWDEPDQKRLSVTMRKFNKDDLRDMDFKAYLASSSDDDETEATIAAKETSVNGRSSGKNTEEDQTVQKYRALLNEIEAKEHKDDDDQHMEISWEPGLSEKTDQIIKNRAEKEKEKSMTPWEKYKKERKKKSKQRKQIGKSENKPDENDDSDEREDESEEEKEEELGFDHPFFTEDLSIGEDTATGNTSKRKRRHDKEDNEQNKNELELLLMEDKKEKQHFNLKSIVANEKSKRKKKKDKGKTSKATFEDNFEIDVQDSRFAALYTSHDYAPDPSDPQFKKTKAMDKILEEKQRRRKENENRPKSDVTAEVSTKKKQSVDPSLSALIKTVKSRTEHFQKQKKKSLKITRIWWNSLKRKMRWPKFEDISTRLSGNVVLRFDSHDVGFLARKQLFFKAICSRSTHTATQPPRGIRADFAIATQNNIEFSAIIVPTTFSFQEGTGVLAAEGALSTGAPVFTDNSSMNPVVVSKGQDSRPERWKSNNVDIATTPTTVQLELSPGFVSPEQFYYVTQEYVNGYPIQLTNGDGINFQQAAMPEPSSPMNDDASSTQADPSSPEDLKRLIRQQFEYYFSRENLASDAYLVSQMDNDQFVSIATVARFNQIKKLTSDLELISEALKDSQNVQLNETGDKVRANTKRCVVILREIPDSTPIQEIKDLFDAPNCPKYANCEFAHNNSWYITFDTEEAAQKAYWYLREEVKNFQGKPIMARIKAKTFMSRSTMVRSQNGASNSSQPETSPQAPAQPVFSQRQFGAFTVPTAVIAGQQPFPYYPAPILQTTWIEPRPQFFPPEMISQTSQFQPTSFVKPVTITGPRQFFTTTKQRLPTKTFFKADNAERLTEKDEKSQSNSFRRSAVNNRVGSGTNHFTQKDDRRPPHLRNKREEVVPRFQRLRERERKQMEANNHQESDTDNLSLDLAPENFPALPSPSSPNDKAQQETSSLKELAANVLSQSNVQVEKVEKSDDSSSETWLRWNNSNIPKSFNDSSNVFENGPAENEPTLNGKPASPPLCVTPPPTEKNQCSSRPSYAQMAQKPKTKQTSTLSKTTAAETTAVTTTTNNNNNTNDLRSPKGGKSESTDNKNAGRSAKQNNSKQGAEKRIEIVKEEAESIANTNGLSPKSRRPQMRESRIKSDPGAQPSGSQKATARNHSYNGPSSLSAKASYASKSSANVSSLPTPSAKSPPTKARTSPGGAQGGQSSKPSSLKNSPKNNVIDGKGQKNNKDSLDLSVESEKAPANVERDAKSQNENDSDSNVEEN